MPRQKAAAGDFELQAVCTQLVIGKVGTLRGIIEHVVNLHKTSLCSPKISLKFGRNKLVHSSITYRWQALANR